MSENRGVATVKPDGTVVWTNEPPNNSCFPQESPFNPQPNILNIQINRANEVADLRWMMLCNTWYLVRYTHTESYTKEFLRRTGATEEELVQLSESLGKMDDAT